MNPPCAVVLRPARLPDARRMAEMSRELIERGLRWRYTPVHMAALIAEAETSAVVACDGPRVTGFAVMHFGESRAHLLLLCVQPDRRRRGIGRQLVQWLLDSARAAGIAAIDLELRADNPGARAFYEQLGFRQTEMIPGYYGGRVAAQKMVLKLGLPQD